MSSAHVNTDDSRHDKDEEKNEYEEFEDSFDDVLNFYAIQLQSHAATLVSFAIGVFILMQTWSSYGAQGGLVGALVFSIFGALLTLGVFYTSLRLLVYGQLSKALLYGTRKTYVEFKEDYNAKAKDWQQLFANTKVSYYANFYFRKNWLRKKHFRFIKGTWLYMENAQPDRRLLSFVLVLSFVILTFFVFGTPQTRTLLACISGVR